MGGEVGLGSSAISPYAKTAKSLRCLLAREDRLVGVLLAVCRCALVRRALDGPGRRAWPSTMSRR